MNLQQTRPVNSGPRYQGNRAQALASLNQLFKVHLRYSADARRVVSNATRNDRFKLMSQMVKDLHAKGYKIRDINNLGGRHVRVLAALWETERALSSSSLQKRFSTLKLLCRWIGKPGLVGDPRQWLSDPSRYDRSYIATEDKSWCAHGADQREVIARIAEKDPAVAVQLRLADAFGLRVQEAALLRPHQAEREGVLIVKWGTKGGRPRTVPIETDTQREALDAARALAAFGDDSTIPRNKTLYQWLNHLYYIVRRYGGVKRVNGVTLHGLRHGYANDRFEALTGQPTAVRGGSGAGLSAEDEQAARQAVSRELGHNRVQITRVYYGKRLRDQNERAPT